MKASVGGADSRDHPPDTGEVLDVLDREADVESVLRSGNEAYVTEAVPGLKIFPAERIGELKSLAFEHLREYALQSTSYFVLIHGSFDRSKGRFLGRPDVARPTASGPCTGLQNLPPVGRLQGYAIRRRGAIA